MQMIQGWPTPGIDNKKIHHRGTEITEEKLKTVLAEGAEIAE